ncbi:LysR substrate-binding domain-containing protein [Streptomyces cupreus]|uniref:LysR substrate-binding domain-containing protein n=1 Tax=Streptomyces cupreus TaxID=2759956 RepID=A0A7X1M8E5_9ACTN|nr:LysR substrate-binding domain-containing protein [Streptomyces cupreus]MBC2901596.1 hypothetical protein [Streptomyces cupreus]
MPVITDLVIEMVAGGQGATILPNWVAAPYTNSHDLALIQIGAVPMARTWYLGTRQGRRTPHLQAFVDELTTHLTRPWPSCCPCHGLVSRLVGCGLRPLRGCPVRPWEMPYRTAAQMEIRPRGNPRTSPR